MYVLETLELPKWSLRASREDYIEVSKLTKVPKRRSLRRLWEKLPNELTIMIATPGDTESREELRELLSSISDRAAQIIALREDCTRDAIIGKLDDSTFYRNVEIFIKGGEAHVRLEVDNRMELQEESWVLLGTYPLERFILSPPPTWDSLTPGRGRRTLARARAVMQSLSAA